MRATAANVPLIAQSWRSAALWLESPGASLLAMTSLPAGDHAASGAAAGTKVSISGVSDPTGSRAAAVVDRSAVFASHRQSLECEIHAAQAALDRVVDRISGMVALMPAPPKPADIDVDEQCRQGCGTPRAVGRHGNCEPCDRWLARHLHADGSRPHHVDAAVLDRRKARNDNRRIHVTGPLALEHFDDDVDVDQAELAQVPA